MSDSSRPGAIPKQIFLTLGNFRHMRTLTGLGVTLSVWFAIMALAFNVNNYGVNIGSSLTAGMVLIVLGR